MDGVPRRAFLFMPFAFAGLMAVWIRKQRPLPDPARGGVGTPVRLALFDEDRKRKGTIEVNKIVKSDEEWRRELSPDEFAVTRKKGTEPAFRLRVGATLSAHRFKDLAKLTGDVGIGLILIGPFGNWLSIQRKSLKPPEC
jgi:hypothetical protein